VRGGDGAGGEVDGDHLTEDHGGVVLTAQDLPRGGGDLPFGQYPGCHLVQQRLEQMVRGAGDHGHLHRSPAQVLDGEKAAEAGADDDDPVRVPGRARLGGGRVGRMIHARSLPDTTPDQARAGRGIPARRRRHPVIRPE